MRDGKKYKNQIFNGLTDRIMNKKARNTHQSKGWIDLKVISLKILIEINWDLIILLSTDSNKYRVMTIAHIHILIHKLAKESYIQRQKIVN